jgi:DNA polymerase-3 subunit delta'
MSFKEIKGQELAVSFLKNAIAHGTVAHAYLFAGIPGVGKRLSATTFAKALNCEQNAGDACDVCASCRKIENKNHPDVVRIMPEGSQGVIKIGAIRMLTNRIALRPYEARWKVYIIEEAQSMTEEAENCLLKTLEEPPGQAVLIATTSHVTGLLPTIVSRCQAVRFAPLSSEVIETILIKKFGFHKQNARCIAHLSQGGMHKKAIVEGEAFIAWKNRLIDEYMNGSFFEEESTMISCARSELKEALAILINWCRDLLVYKHGVDQDALINVDRIKELDRFSKQDSYTELDRRLHALMDAYVAVGQNVNPKLIIGALT